MINPVHRKLQKQPEAYRQVEWLNLILTHILLVLMMGCVGMVIMQVMGRLAPGWPSGVLPLLCVLISLEAIGSWYITRRKTDLELSEITTIIIEWIVLLIVIRLFLSLRGGIGAFLNEVPLWQRDFLGVFFTSQYLTFIFLAASVWGLARIFTGDLAETRGDELLNNVEALGGYSSDRWSIRQRMAGIILGVGFVLVVLTTLLYLDARYVSKVLHLSRAGLLSVIFYFLFGLGLLSQVQFSVLRAAWVWEKVNYDPSLLKRWTAYSLVFLLVVSLLAFSLPTGYSLGLLATLHTLLGILLSAVYLLFFLVMSPLLWLLSLLGRGGKEQPAEALPPPQMPRMPEQLQGAPPVPWWEFVKSLLFWLFFLGLIGYAVYHYVRQNQVLMEKLRRLRLFNWLAGTWKWIVGVLQGWNQEIGSAVQAGLQRLRQRREGVQADLARRFVNPRRLTPRQRVMFFYLAMVRRGGERGLPRHPTQTPEEYALMLRRNLPNEVDQDLEDITGGFMEARYTRHPIEADQASHARRVWERIQRVLREWGKVK